MAIALRELALQTGASLAGDDLDGDITHVASLSNAGPGAITFLNDPKYRPFLASTQAAAVILRAEDAEACPVPVLITKDPYLTYAKVAAMLFPSPIVTGGRAPSAVVGEDCEIDDTAWIGPCAVVERGCRIEAGAYIGPGCVVGGDTVIGRDSRLVARVTICHGTRIGRRALIHPGAVIGSDGFGLAFDGERWIKVPQVGRVRIGDDVEIGANTTVDRGAVEDTVIADGVKLDNQIQVAHNVHIGDNTAIAGCAGIAGSTHIGKNCTVGGGVGIAGHLEIGDNVHFSGQSLVTRSYKEPGYYSGNLPSMPNKDWRKAVAWIRRLDEMMQRLRTLEKRVGDAPPADKT